MLVVFAGATAAVVAASVSSPTTPKWLPARDLSAKGADAVIPDVSVDANGDAVVVWAQSKASSWTVEEAERPAGGSWSAPRPLSVPANHVGPPQVAIAGDTVVAVWDRFDGKSKNLLVQTAERDPKTHTWTAPTTLSGSGRDAQAPKVAVNARGDAVAVWASVSLQGWSIQAAYRAVGGAWQPTVPLQSPQVGTAVPDIVLDDTGRAVAVWTATAGGGWRVWASTRGTDGAWKKSVAISGPDATGSITPQIALEGSGDVTAVWSRTVGTTSILESATWNAKTGAWSPPVQLFPTETNAVSPTIAVNERGDGVLAWTSSDPQSGLSLKVSYRRHGKAWGAPVTLASAAGGPLAPQVAIDGRGNALVVWTRRVSGFSRVQSSSVTGDGASPARTLSRAGADAVTPQVALDPAGDGAAVWARYDGKSFVVQAEGYDGNGPELTKLSMPGTGIIGKRLTFAVTPKDTWTTVRTIRWVFGDGAVGGGRATGHVYTRPGKYLARVTATDGSGNVSSVRRFVTISAS